MFHGEADGRRPRIGSPIGPRGFDPFFSFPALTHHNTLLLVAFYLVVGAALESKPASVS